MLAMKVMIGTLFACNHENNGDHACNFDNKGDLICLQSHPIGTKYACHVENRP